MRRVWITKAGGPEVLQVREEPDPEAKAGEVRVRVRAAGINFADLMARMGLYPEAKLPCVVGFEVAGVVDQVGQDVSGLAKGDRVMAVPFLGGYTDTLVVPAAQVFKLPEAMTFEEAAGFPVAYGTAHNMMLFCGQLRRGSTVLVHSAAGGVGLAALDIARTRDCVVIGVASASKHAFLRERGCTHTIDSRADYVAETRRIVGDRGVDLVLDPVGGKSWREGFDLLGTCGRLACFGFSKMVGGEKRNLLRAGVNLLRAPRFSPLELMGSNKTVSGTNMAALFGRPDIFRSAFDDLMPMYERNELHPHVDETFQFAQAPAAHHYLHQRKAKGKVLLVP